MIRALLAEWLARLGIKKAFSNRVHQGHLLARLSSWVFKGNLRGTLLLLYFLLPKGRIKSVVCCLEQYYDASDMMAAWSRRIEQWRGRYAGRKIFRKIEARIFSLSTSWRRIKGIPRQVQAVLWNAEEYKTLTKLASKSNQIALQAHAILAEGNPEAALEKLSHLSTESLNGEAVFVRARCLKAIGKTSQAIDELELHLESVGAGKALHQLLCDLYLSIGCQARAIEIKRKLEQEFRQLPWAPVPSQDGRVFHLITEDHEFSITPGKSDGRPWLSIREAQIQLIEKGKLINRIATDFGTPWTHLIDIGSYLVIKSAAENFPSTWGTLLSEYRSFMTETLSSGHDLGIHVHADKSPMSIMDVDPERIWLKQDMPGWGQLNRFGPSSDTCSKSGLVRAGKELIEESAKLANITIRTAFFRAGSYDVGATLFETAESAEAIIMAGLPVASDALEMDGITESLGRLNQPVYSCASQTPWLSNDQGDHWQVLPLRTKDFQAYSVLGAARHHIRDPHVLQRIEDSVRSISHLVSIDHEIDIGNTRYSQSWDDLSLDSYDWKALAKYLRNLGKSKVFRCVRARDILGSS